MRRNRHTHLITLGCALAAISGCRSPDSARVRDCEWAASCRTSPNLLLGARSDENLLALDYSGRSSWPWKPDGYVFDEYETSYEFQYDSQRFIDRDGGTFWRGADSVRVRTRSR
ncbi:MAG: hypothetical protein ACKVS9_10025 [Phycisphaerae bacterium]